MLRNITTALTSSHLRLSYSPMEGPTYIHRLPSPILDLMGCWLRTLCHKVLPIMLSTMVPPLAWPPTSLLLPARPQLPTKLPCLGHRAHPATKPSRTAVTGTATPSPIKRAVTSVVLFKDAITATIERIRSTSTSRIAIRALLASDVRI